MARVDRDQRFAPDCGTSRPSGLFGVCTPGTEGFGTSQPFGFGFVPPRVSSLMRARLEQAAVDARGRFSAERDHRATTEPIPALFVVARDDESPALAGLS